MSIILFSDVSQIYPGEIRAISHVSLAIEEGELVFLIDVDLEEQPEWLSLFKDKMYEKAVIKYPEFIIPDDVGNPYDLISFEATKSIDLERTKRILSCELKRPTKVDPIKLNSFMKMIQQVIVEEKNNIKLSAGEVHRWSKQSRR